MELSGAASQGTPPPVPWVNVTLIHGTYARKASWPSSGAMVNGLTAAGMACNAFTWSGRNSHHARFKAASRLETFLREQRDAHPALPQAIVAHSHGGNIALHAVDELVDSSDQPIPVVTLATPFLFAGPQRVYPAVLAAAGIGGFVVLLVAGVVGVVLAQNGPTAGGWLVYGLACLLPALILLQLVAALYWVLRHGPVWLQDNREQCVRNVQTPATQNDHLLVVRAADDEASSSLAFAQISGRVSSMAVGLARPHTWVPIASAFALLGAALDVIGAKGVSDALLQAFALAAGSVCFLCLALVSVPALVSLCYGLDGATTSTFAFVTAEATPPGRCMVRQRPINPPDQGGLAHSSLYGDPEVVGWVVEHLTKVLAHDPST